MEQMKLTDGITLLTGARFSYEHPEQSDVSIDDIANPLAHICRYAGQLPYFYSVAQHAVNATFLVEAPFKYTALMHDTAEAFTNDIVTPLKAAVPMFKVLEQRIEGAMSEKFGFIYPLPKEVELADRIMLGLEMKHIRGQDMSDHAIFNGIEFDWDTIPAGIDLKSWGPKKAKLAFMKKFNELTPL